MASNLFQHVDNLKSALMSLPATGIHGFEGLIATALREINGVPFRLAGSGSQFGIDGKATYEADSICFEGKRYEDAVPRTEILSKLAELSLVDADIDIWVLGATSPIRQQLADFARQFGDKNGIAILILDWSQTDLPPLAVALAMGKQRVLDFLYDNISDKIVYQNAVAALKAIEISQDFNSHADRIHAECNDATLGIPLAQKANTQWLNDAFTNRKHAKTKLNQPLSPGDNKTANVLLRSALIDTLHPFLITTQSETIVFIHGGEGHGKSWIVAQGWLSLTQKPLMIFMSPDDFEDRAPKNDIIDIIINKLITQSGDHATDTGRKRWHRRMKQWRNRPIPEKPRLIAVIDGINQRPNYDWARIIDKIADEFSHLGFRLIVTVRTPFFRDHVKRRLTERFAEIEIPEWTESERDNILIRHGIVASNLHFAVATSLRNPRLLGIALELLDKADIANFEELSVSRLLFEHMRMTERDASVVQSAQKFAHQLQLHAQEIITRVNENQKDDILLFQSDMIAVADGRFFKVVEGDSFRYALQDEGLTLALGFAIIDRLRVARRNLHNLDAELEAILDPIAALDDTAGVILAALTVATVDENYEQDVVASLVKGFTLLQNPDQTQFSVFASHAKIRPKGFMDAAYSLCLAGGEQPNFDWVQNALILASKNRTVWQEMSSNIKYWLSLYSLNPIRGILRHRDFEEPKKFEERRASSEKRIQENLSSLSQIENNYLRKLNIEDGDISTLSKLAFYLLAGKPLEPLSESFVNWSISNALNYDTNAPYKEFNNLLNLNRVDWTQTRASLLELIAPLRDPTISKTGKWTLLKILNATGNSADGIEADAIMEDLTRDLPRFEPWSLIEQYCATDPCDPESEEPENIGQTAEQYTQIDVSKLCLFFDQTNEDHEFEISRAGMARFRPAIAVAKHKEFITDVIHRTGIPLRQGLFHVADHAAILTSTMAYNFLQKGKEISDNRTASGFSEQDTKLLSQYCLLVSFPFLNAHEQYKALLDIAKNEAIIIDVLNLAKPLTESDFERMLITACNENNEHSQYLLLLLARFTHVQLSTRARNQILTLFQSGAKRIRTQALGVIARTQNEDLLGAVAHSTWRAADTDGENNYESFCGSLILIKAAEKGLIQHEMIIDRISPRYYCIAATKLSSEALSAIAQRICGAITNVIGLSSDLVVPEIEIHINPIVNDTPSSFSLNEQQSPTKISTGKMDFLAENIETFDARQRRHLEIFHTFEASLTREKASVILDSITLKEFAFIVASSRDLANRWYEIFMKIDESRLPLVQNLILMLAYAMGSDAPEKAQMLFNKVKDVNGLIHFNFSGSRVSLEAMAVWGGIRNPILDALRIARLDRAGTDNDVSIEVLAALLNNQQELLDEYIQTKLQREEPIEISRALMATGYSDLNQFNDDLLSKFKGSGSLIGKAHATAMNAYMRNRWARHWYEQLCQTNDNEDFWRCAILFEKLVDGRYALWRNIIKPTGAPFLTFGHTLHDRIENRLRKQESNRKNKLFGEEIPARMFLEGE